MNLKRLLSAAGSNNIPFYILVLFLFYVAVKYSPRRHAPPAALPDHLRRYLRFDEQHALAGDLTPDEITQLQVKFERWNNELVMLNTKPYSPFRMDGTIIAVQAHADVERLQYLIVSLAQVKHIEHALLVFSHSYYDEAVNGLVRNITFCRVMQIFYPHSLQLHPDRFPGTDPEDCRNETALNPQKYCNERDPRVTEHKQHWWWKANLIFDHLEFSHKFKGMVIFLEADDYVLPDALHMLNYAKRSVTSINDIEVISLGRPYAKDLDYDLLTVDTWRPPYDRGLAFNRTTWKKILALSSHFCMFDDFSWSYSLLNLFTRFSRGRVDMMACTAPRVWSTGMYPSGRTAMEAIQARVEQHKMYPKSVRAVMLYSQAGRVGRGLQAPPKGNGGWNDMRDHLLCLDPLLSAGGDTEDDSTTTTMEM